MIWTVLGFVARVLGPILPFLAVWVARGQLARLRGKNEALEADQKADRRMDHADVSRGDADADDKWLRGRSKK